MFLKKYLSGDKAESVDERFLKLSHRIPIIDTHNDFPYLLRVQLHNKVNELDFNSHLTSNTDLPKLKEGHVGVQFFSVYIECKDGGDFLYTDFNQINSAVRDTLEQIDVTKRLVAKHFKDMKFVNSSKEAMETYQNEKKIAITLGVEGLHQCDLSLAVVRIYYELGVRYITLTHNCDNPFAMAASSIPYREKDFGLTEYGVECVHEMNRLGMMVDLSHVSYQTMLDVLNVTEAPVIFSHSSVYKLTPHERNVRDDVLLKLKENGGVIQINFCPAFITSGDVDEEGNSIATISDAINHVSYVIDLIGWDHVGFGSDFDGIPGTPRGLEDVSKYPDLVKSIWSKYDATEEQIAKLMGLNTLRVWSECERISEVKKGHKCIEAQWSDRLWEFPTWAKTAMPEIYPGSKQIYDKSTKWIDGDDLIKK
ncbi:LAFE_0B07998g1_1 [Lachancea fermentati]|uniref:Dipeptidase n=1 Tax=Lachancea fermentati TaxID=4955 RepID=A0A1G4M898_LACFM|nr:LAFE_0B07998g1_1 [Lachancea fermentati]